MQFVPLCQRRSRRLPARSDISRNLHAQLSKREILPYLKPKMHSVYDVEQLSFTPREKEQLFSEC